MQQVNLGMIGGGTVGSGVFHALQQNGDLMAARLGVKIAFRKIAVKAFDEPRPYPIPRSLMTTDWQEVVNDPQIHVVIELVGGTGIAKTMVLAALAQGKTVVTANKALLSAHGQELFAAAAKVRCESLLRGERLRRDSHHQIVARRFCGAISSPRSTASSTAPAITSSRA